MGIDCFKSRNCFRIVPFDITRSVLTELRLRQIRSGILSTIATAGQSYCRESAINELRLSALTLVASITVRRRAFSRLQTTKYRTSNASAVAAGLSSSSLTSLRQKSDEMISEGRKKRSAKVDLPEPDGPASVTSENAGISIVATYL